jgi:hypothetical protein
MDSHLDPTFLMRVRKSYARSAHRVNLRSCWGVIENTVQAPLHAALRADSDEPLRAIFADPASSDLFYGVDNICQTVLNNHKQDADGFAADQRRRYALMRQQMGGDDSSEPEAMLAELDVALHQHVEFPTPFRGEAGLPTSRGLSSWGALEALYQTWRMLALLRTLSGTSGGTSNGASVFEIGPGMGRAALFAVRAGIADYTTVDLPLGVVRQACFLGAVLGPDKLWFAGEPAELAAGRIKLLSVSDPLPSLCFDLVVNVDSMTEIPVDAAAAYLRWIEHHARLFYSLNHDRNDFTVTQLVNYMRWRPSERRPWVMQPGGYVEEVFAFDAAIDPTINPAMASRWRPRLDLYLAAAYARGGLGPWLRPLRALFRR